MGNKETIMDLSDFAERDIKDEVARIKDSITALERLIDKNEKESDESGKGISGGKLKAAIRENMEEINLPIEMKCDALELKINTLQDSVDKLRKKQEKSFIWLCINTVGVGLILVIFCYLLAHAY